MVDKQCHTILPFLGGLRIPHPSSPRSMGSSLSCHIQLKQIVYGMSWSKVRTQISESVSWSVSYQCCCKGNSQVIMVLSLARQMQLIEDVSKISIDPQSLSLCTISQVCASLCDIASLDSLLFMRQITRSRGEQHIRHQCDHDTHQELSSSKPNDSHFSSS